MPQTRPGLIYGVLAYGCWGLVPIYFRSIRALPSQEILAHRVVWSALLLGIIVSVVRRWRDVGRCFADWKRLLPLLLSAILIAINWLAYIQSVAHERIVEASLGYFITPLFQVLLGVAITSSHRFSRCCSASRSANGCGRCRSWLFCWRPAACWCKSSRSARCRGSR